MRDIVSRFPKMTDQIPFSLHAVQKEDYHGRKLGVSNFLKCTFSRQFHTQIHYHHIPSILGVKHTSLDNSPPKSLHSRKWNDLWANQDYRVSRNACSTDSPKSQTWLNIFWNSECHQAQTLHMGWNLEIIELRKWVLQPRLRQTFQGLTTWLHQCIHPKQQWGAPIQAINAMTTVESCLTLYLVQNKYKEENPLKYEFPQCLFVSITIQSFNGSTEQTHLMWEDSELHYGHLQEATKLQTVNCSLSFWKMCVHLFLACCLARTASAKNCCSRRTSNSAFSEMTSSAPLEQILGISMSPSSARGPRTTTKPKRNHVGL